MRHRQMGKARLWETQPEGHRGQNTLKGWDMSKVPGAIGGIRKEGRKANQDVLCPQRTSRTDLQGAQLKSVVRFVSASQITELLSHSDTVERTRKPECHRLLMGNPAGNSAPLGQDWCISQNSLLT